MTMNVLNPDNKPVSLRVNADGELLTAGGGGGGGGGDASATNQLTQIARAETGNTSLAAIDTKLGTLNTQTDGLEASASSIDSKLSTLITQTDGIEASLTSMDAKLTQLGKSGGREYETVAASQTDQVLGPTGSSGDYIEGLICVVSTAATSQVQIKDGNGSAITVLPNSVGAGVGTYYVPLGLTAVNGTTPGWKVTTAAGVSVIALGDFS